MVMSLIKLYPHYFGNCNNLTFLAKISCHFRNVVFGCASNKIEKWQPKFLCYYSFNCNFLIHKDLEILQAIGYGCWLSKYSFT